MPHFDDLAIGKPVNRNPRPFQLLSCCGNAVERALVGTVKRHPGHDLIAFGDLVPDDQTAVRESPLDCQQEGGVMCLEIPDIVENHILGEKAVECSQVSPVHDLVEIAADDCFVLLEIIHLLVSRWVEIRRPCARISAPCRPCAVATPTPASASPSSRRAIGSASPETPGWH